MTGMLSPPEPVIRVDDLRAGYGGTVILDGLTFEVTRGEVFVILGGSGGGKSTLLKHMIGLHQPLSGKIHIEGQDIVASEGEDRVRLLNRIGVMYQQGALFGSLTLLENVRVPLEEFTDLPPPARDLISQMKLRMVGLQGFEHHLPSDVSGGMKKRAAIARAMSLDPRILFLDEPSAGLDPITSAELDQLILKLRDRLGITFVIVSHELPSIYAVADRVILIDKTVKNIVASGKPQELRDHSENEWVRRFFNRQPQAT